MTALSDLEYYGKITRAGIIIREGSTPVLVLSEKDGRLHIPSKTLDVNEGLAACAVRALSEWTVGAITLKPHTLKQCSYIIVEKSLYFVLPMLRSSLNMVNRIIKKNAERHTLQGSLPAFAPRILIPVPPELYIHPTLTGIHRDRVVDHGFSFIPSPVLIAAWEQGYPTICPELDAQSREVLVQLNNATLPT